MKDLYREETNHDVYADYCCERPAGSYADEYVRWLEDKLSKLSQHDVILPLPTQCCWGGNNNNTFGICSVCGGMNKGNGI